ncbi:hypothetical protein [Streptomyces pseudogriseolus]|uniref:hypothetical protein n=1 Tax=Streptomyces pseudogriseolus TaxID=36817 RepID=UPI003FA1C8E8
MSWTGEYVFGAEEAARTAPPAFLAEIERKADDSPHNGRRTRDARALRAPETETHCRDCRTTGP